MFRTFPRQILCSLHDNLIIGIFALNVFFDLNVFFIFRLYLIHEAPWEHSEPSLGFASGLEKSNSNLSIAIYPILNIDNAAPGEQHDVLVLGGRYVPVDHDLLLVFEPRMVLTTRRLNPGHAAGILW